MKKVLKYNKKNTNKILKLKKLWVIYFSTKENRYHTQTWMFSGRYTKENIPMVVCTWNKDCNKNKTVYVTKSIEQITDGRIVCWVFNEHTAWDILVALQNNISRDEESEDS